MEYVTEYHDGRWLKVWAKFVTADCYVLQGSCIVRGSFSVLRSIGPSHGLGLTVVKIVEYWSKGCFRISRHAFVLQKDAERLCGRLHPLFVCNMAAPSAGNFTNPPSPMTPRRPVSISLRLIRSRSDSVTPQTMGLILYLASTGDTHHPPHRRASQAKSYPSRSRWPG